jgi:hypothetical protein
MTEQARQTLQTERAKVQDYKAQIAEQEELARQNELVLKQQREKLPSNESQRALRQKLAGLKGREQRRIIEDIKQDISTKEGYIKQSREEFGKFKEELGSYEKGLQDYEKEIERVELIQQDYEAVKKASEKDQLGLIVMYGTEQQKQIAKDFVESENKELRDWYSQVETIQESLPKGEKLNIDWNKTKISGVSSEAFGGSLSLDEYSKKIESLQKNAIDLDSKVQLKEIPILDIKEPETVATKEFKLATGIGLVSGMTMEPKIRTSSVPTNKEVYKEFIKDNPLSGTIKFGIEKFKGFTTNILSGKTYSPFTYSDISGIPEAIEKVSSPLVLTAKFIESPKKTFDETKIKLISDLSYFDKSISEIKKQGDIEKKQKEKFNELSKDLQNLQGEELNRRLNEIKSVGGKVVTKIDNEGNIIYETSYQESKVRVGFGDWKREIPISRIDTRTKTGAYSSFWALESERILKNINYPKEGKYEKKVIPETELNIFGGTGIYNPLTGKYEPQKLTIPEREEIITILPPIETASEIVSTGRYFSPYIGQLLFFGETGGKFLELSTEEGKLDLWSGTKKMVKEYPFDTLAIGTLGTIKVAQVTGKAFTPRITYLDETLKPMIPSKAQNIMSKEEALLISEKGMGASREFTGRAFGETLTQGRRTIVSTPARDLFGMKPIYSGRYVEDVKGYKKAFEYFTEKGIPEKEVVKILRRISPMREAQVVSYGGKIIQSDKSIIDLTGMRYRGGLKEKIILDYKGRKIESPTRVGKPKQEEVSILLENIKSKTPIGKEEGEIGELSFFKGKGEEFNPLKDLGKRSKEFKEGAIAKKTGEETFDLGKIETYKTGEVSKEITYLKPKKVSGSQIDVDIINPTIQKQTIFDLPSGVKTVQVKPMEKVDDLIVKSEEWTKVSEELLPIKTGGSNIIKPANIKKTPLSKTFGKDEELITLYHGTTKESAESIKMLGFKGDTSFTTNKEFAESFARRKAVTDRIKGIKSEPEVLEFKITKEEYLKARGQTKSKFYEEVVIKKDKVDLFSGTKDLPEIKGGSNLLIIKNIETDTKPLAEVTSKVLDIKTKQLPKTLNPLIEESPKMIGSSSVKVIPSASSINIEEVPAKTIPAIKETSLMKEGITPKIDTSFKSSQPSRASEGIKLDLGQKPSFKLGESQKVSQQEKQSNRVGFKEMFSLLTGKTTKTTKTPKTTEIKIPKGKIKLGIPSKEDTTKSKTTKGLFKVLVRKKGKDIEIGEFETERTAKQELFKTIRKEIRASGFVEKGGEKIKIDLSGTEFRPSKVDEFRVVEPKRRRIKRGTSESSQLKQAKKNKFNWGF